MAFEIRRAIDADIEAIVEFNMAMALETETKTLDRTTLRAGVNAVLCDPAHGFYLVTERSAEVVACTLVTYEWSDWRNGQFWWIQSVYVRPDHRGMGVFSAIYRYVEALAKRTPGVIGIRLYVVDHNQRARGLYRHLGMAETDYRLMEAQFE